MQFIAIAFAVIVPIVVKLLIALGVGFVTFQGIDLAFDGLRGLVLDYFEALDTYVFSFLVLMGFDQFIGLIFSAMSTGLVLKGMDIAGSIRSLRFSSGA